MDGRALLLWQYGGLLVTAAGWGFWLWLAAGRPAPFRGLAWLWCGLGGFCAHALVLQSLVYLDLPLARTAWPALGVAVAGLAGAGWWSWRARDRQLRAAWLEVRWLAGVFLVVVAVQSSGLLAVGPADYFGHGRYDQANYVATAQFLVDRPFSTTGAEIGLHPWLAKAIEAKEQRITQSVAHGALAVVSGTDCQQAYGAISIFFLGLAGVAVAAWLRTMAVPRWLAAVGGAGAALGPAVTRLQLEGYFSQAATLFVFPALAGLLARRGPWGAWQRVVTPLLLAFLAGAYSELAVVGVGMVIVLRLLAEGPWRGRARDLAWVGLGALLANPGFLLRLPRFLREQAVHFSTPGLLAALVPESGTWRGWGRLFLDLPAGRGADAAMVLAGVGILVLMGAAIGGRPWSRSRLLLATLLVPAVALGWLLWLPVLEKYPFAKLTAGFAPLWVGTAVLGMTAWIRRPTSVRIALTAVFFGAGAVSAWPQHLPIIRREGPLAALDSPAMHRVRLEISRHPGRTWLVDSDDPLVAQWLGYFARDAEVYVDSPVYGDRVVPSETYAFRRLPAGGAALWRLDLAGPVAVADYPPACTLRIRGALEEGGVALGRYYLVRNALEFEVERPAAGPPRQVRWLDLVGTPMAGAGTCDVVFTAADGRSQHATLAGPHALRFRLDLSAGINRATLRVQPAGRLPAGAGAVVLQSLSLDPITTPDVGPAE